MASSEDRQFFEDLNKDLANSVSDAISSAFNDFGKAFNESMTKGISKAISEGFEESGSGKGKGDKKEKEKDAFTKLSQALGKVGKAFGTLKGIAKPLDGAGAQIRQFGNTMARTVAQTGNQALVNARLQKGALTGLKELKIDSLSETISGSFADFGIGLGQTGQILDTALRGNAKVTEKGTQDFLARAVGLGNDLGLATQAIATNTNFLGLSTDASNNFNQGVIQTAQANGRLADTIFQAVEAFKENTRSQQVVFGTHFAGTMRGVVAGLQAAMPDTGIIDAVGKITGTDFKQQQATAALLSRLNVGASTQELSQDPAAVLAKMFKAIESDLGRFQNDPRAMASQMELMASQAGLNKSDIEAILTQSSGRSTAELEKIMRNQAGKTGPTAGQISDEQVTVGGLSVDASEAMKDAKLAIHGANVAFNMLSTTTETVRASLDAFDGALAKTMGTLAGGVAGVGMGADATGAAGMFSSIVDTVSLIADVRGLLRGRRPRGRRSSRAPRSRPTPRGTKPSLSNRAKDMFRRTPSRPPSPNWVTTPARPPVPKGGLGAGARSLATGRVGGALKGVSKKVPLLGAAISGGLELAESGDKSRAGASAAGAGLGGWGGAAAGAAIGSMIFPGVGTAIGGLIGGVLGAWGGEAGAKAVHDEFDPEYVASQQKKTQEEAKAEREAKTFKGTPEELRAEAEAMAIQQAQLDEQTKLNMNIERMVDFLNEPGGEGGPERVSGFGYGQFHTKDAVNRFDERYDDNWERLEFLNAYHAKRMQIKHGGGN